MGVLGARHEGSIGKCNSGQSDVGREREAVLCSAACYHVIRSLHLTRPNPPYLPLHSIAVQLQEQKVAVEAMLRDQLEEEYRNRAMDPQNLDASSATGSIGLARGGTEEEQRLEEQLRNQLLQVKEERERWKSEQDEIQKKVISSQAQFTQVKDGFKSK